MTNGRSAAFMPLQLGNACWSGASTASIHTLKQPETHAPARQGSAPTWLGASPVIHPLPRLRQSKKAGPMPCLHMLPGNFPACRLVFLDVYSWVTESPAIRRCLFADGVSRRKPHRPPKPPKPIRPTEEGSGTVVFCAKHPPRCCCRSR